MLVPSFNTFAEIVWKLFHETDLLNPALNCFVRFTLYLVDKVTIETCNLASIILNFGKFPALDKMQSSIQLNSKWILQVINGISTDLKKLL